MEQTAAERPTPSRRTLVLIVTPIIGIIVMGTIGNAIHPKLLVDHPLLLVFMEPRNRYLLLVAGEGVDFVPFLLVGTIRRLLSDPLFYLLGYLYGENGVRWIEGRMGEGGGMIRAFEKGFAKAAPVMVFLFPGAIVCVLAGATGMNIATFFVLNVVGTLTAITLLYRLAEVPVVSDVLDTINRFYANNNKWLIIVSIALTVLWAVTQQRRGTSEIQSIDEIERQLEGDKGDAEVLDDEG